MTDVPMSNRSPRPEVARTAGRPDRVRPALVVLLALVALAAVACSDDGLPPGAEPLSEEEIAGTAPARPDAVGEQLGSQPPAVEPGAPMESTAQAPAFPQDAPRVVAVDPPNGTRDVDPERTSLSVTFDREMDREGWAWVVEDDATAPEIGDSSFGPQGRTNTVGVDLEPGRDYVVWINSERFPYFKGADGTPAVPYRWTFSTRGGEGSAGGEAGDGGMELLSSRATAAPRVVELDPPNGATGVDPDREWISVTFDRAMEEGWAWVTQGGTTPPPTVGDAHYTADRRTNRLPVDLAPGTTYTIWINSESHQLFRSQQGVPAEPLRWTFTTGPE